MLRLPAHATTLNQNAIKMPVAPSHLLSHVQRLDDLCHRYSRLWASSLSLSDEVRPVHFRKAHGQDFTASSREDIVE